MAGIFLVETESHDETLPSAVAEETAAIAQGLREKAEEFRKSGGEISRAS